MWVKYASNGTICESVIFHNWKGRRLQHGQWGVALASEGLHPSRATGWFKSPVLSLKHYSNITVLLHKLYSNYAAFSLKLYCTVTQVGLSLMYYHSNITQTILYYHTNITVLSLRLVWVCCTITRHLLLHSFLPLASQLSRPQVFFLTTILGKS